MSHSLKSTLLRKGAKAGARHTAHGTASKLKRQPMRAGTLLFVGSVFGAMFGWAIAHAPNHQLD